MVRLDGELDHGVLFQEVLAVEHRVCCDGADERRLHGKTKDFFPCGHQEGALCAKGFGIHFRGFNTVDFLGSDAEPDFIVDGRSECRIGENVA